MTANGDETSPVKRGVWLLEKHRSAQACADCHAKINSLSFGLVHYNPIGHFQSTYPNGASIDTNGEYRDQPVTSPGDIRAYLIQHPDLLAQRRLAYALGRPHGFAERPELRLIHAEWKTRGHTLRKLVLVIAASELIRRPQPSL